MTENNLNLDNDVAILVVSCDAYKDLWGPYFKCLFKYWPDCPYKIYLGSNNLTFPDPRISPIMIGKDLDYSTNLLAMLNEIKEPWVLLWIEDFLLSKPIDTMRLQKIIEDAQLQGGGYLKLIASFPYVYLDDKEVQIGAMPKGIKYRVNIGITLFKKEVLLKLLKPGESAWDIEYNGAERSNHIYENFFCLNSKLKPNPPISYVNAVGKGRWIRNSLPFLKREGFSEIIPNREIQPLGLYIYYRLYLMRLEIYRVLKKYWFDNS